MPIATKPEAECVNMARSGNSSKSYYDKGTWKQALAQKPDFVLIQFGHNDQPGHPGDRETDPQTTYKQFMTQYVDEARAAGVWRFPPGEAGVTGLLHAPGRAKPSGRNRAAPCARLPVPVPCAYDGK